MITAGTMTVKDFTPEQVAVFDEMHRVLTEYNAKLDIDQNTPSPNYSPEEVAAYSQYESSCSKAKYLIKV